MTISKDIISLADVKQALRDERFRKSLPESFTEDIKKFLNNPGCGCNIQLYKKILKEAKSNLQEYFPEKVAEDIETTFKKLSQNNFMVINCEANELEGKLQSLGPGRKQIAIARFEDKVTVIINELDVVY
jgi:hypothetical protein